MLEEQDPSEVNIAKNQAEERKDKAKDVFAIGLFKKRANTDNNFNNPVNSWNYKENELD
jgi:hypothetical protein